MKTQKPLILTSLCLLGLFNLPSARAGDHIGFSIQIGSAPPPCPVVVEQPWTAPSPEMIWVAPHYEWNGYRWVWLRGYYMNPPRPTCDWVPGHYENYHHAHYWVEGFWRNRDHDRDDDHGHDHRR